MDKEYWKKYYDVNGEPFDPSDFAKFCMTYVNGDDRLIDLGCGNGRDTIYFIENNLKCVGVDQCENVVNSLTKRDYPNGLFIVDDFTKLEDENMFLKYDHAYSRFTLHSISQSQEDDVIDWVSNNIADKFFIEVRSDKDALVGQQTDHFRRFVDMNTLIEKLIAARFNIEYAEISRGFSKYNSKFAVDYNEDDPMLIRIVATKILD